MSIVTTREQRRELARQNAKLPTTLQVVPREQWPDSQLRNPALVRVLRSRGFLVQEYLEPAPVLVRLSVLRTTLDPALGRWVDGISWEELQSIKAQCGYEHCDAVEVYPADRDVVNVANLRHLWVLQQQLPFAWRAARSGEKP